ASGAADTSPGADGGDGDSNSGGDGSSSSSSDGSSSSGGSSSSSGDRDDSGGDGDSGGDDQGRVQSKAMSAEAWRALRYAIARLAVDLVSGPAGLAAYLRTQLLEARGTPRRFPSTSATPPPSRPTSAPRCFCPTRDCPA